MSAILILSMPRKPIITNALAEILVMINTEEHEHQLNPEIVPVLDRERLPNVLTVIESCFGLVTMEPGSNRVLFAHADIAASLQSLESEHFKIKDRMHFTSALLRYLLLADFSGGPCATTASLSHRLHQYPFYHYASRYWATHMQGLESLTSQKVALQSGLEHHMNSLRATIVMFLLSRNHLAASVQVSSTSELELQRLEDAQGSEPIDTLACMAVSGLQIACRHGLTQIVSLMVERDRQSLHSCDERNVTPLHEAAAFGPFELVQLIIDAGADIHAQDMRGQTPLNYAATKGNSSFYNLLAAPYPRTKRSDISLALIQAVGNGHVDFIKQAISDAERADIEQAFCEAAENGHAPVLSMIMSSRANDDSEAAHLLHASKGGRTALILATMGEHLETVKWLLKYEMDLSLRYDMSASITEDQDREGATALHHAARRNYSGILELLITSGANINSTDSNGRTALFDAVASPSHDCVSILLIKGIRISITEKAGNSILHEAVSNGSVDFTRLFIYRHININSTNHVGSTPLHLAAEGGHAEIVDFLLKNGAKDAEQDKLGRTPQMLANNAGHREIFLLVDSKLYIAHGDRR